MTKVFSTLEKDEDGLGFILRANLNQVAGVAKHFTRSEFDAAVTLERGRITSNGAGLYQADEPCSIVGEYGTRRWMIGGSAAASHWRTVEIGSVRIVLTGDSNAVWPASGAPASGFGANGDYAFDPTTQILYGKTSGSWAQVLVIGGGGSILPSQIAYSTVIPLDGVKVMPRTQIAAAVALTIGAKAPGGQCRLSFISDGANAPTIGGAAEWSSSFGFDNSGAGLVNILDVWTDDGVNIAFGWSQPAIQSPVDVLGPTISSVTVNGATMVVTYNEALAATPSAAAYTPRNAGGAATQVPSAVSRSGAVVTLTLPTPAVNGNTVTLDVAAGAVTDLVGNSSLVVSGRAVTNNTAPADTTAPSIASASVNGVTAIVVWSEALSGTPNASAFTFVGAGSVTQTASSISQSGATSTLTLATPAVSGDVVTLNVAAGAASDAAGNTSAAVSARAVTNNTAGVAVPASFSTLQNLTNEGGGTYASTSAGGANDSIGVVAGVLAGDGYIEAQKLNTTDCSFYLRFDIASGPITVTEADCAFGVSTAGALAHGENANPTVSATNIGGNASTWLRLERVGSVITGKYSTDNKVSWTTFRPFTLSTTGPLYVSVSVPYSAGLRRIYNPRTLAVA